MTTHLHAGILIPDSEKSATDVNNPQNCDKKVVLGRITTVHGLKGWVKVYSWTQPVANIFSYPVWWLCFPDGQYKKVKIEETHKQGKSLLVRFDKCKDRDSALLYIDAEVLVDADSLPKLMGNEFYWHQIEGLTVVAVDEDGKSVNIGKVHHLIETGANDVLVIHATNNSIDDRERLVPWIESEVILSVDPSKQLIRVKWDPEF